MLLTFYLAIQLQPTTLSTGSFIKKKKREEKRKKTQKPQALPRFCSKSVLNMFYVMYI